MPSSCRTHHTILGDINMSTATFRILVEGVSRISGLAKKLHSCPLSVMEVANKSVFCCHLSRPNTCIVVQKKKKRNTLIYFNANYRREMKLVPPPQIFQRNRKVHVTNRLEINFHDISIISLRIIRCRNYS